MTNIENGGSSEARRNRLLFRSQRRGFKELDLIFGTFAATQLNELSEAELDQLDALLSVPDDEIYAWLRGYAPVPAGFVSPVFDKLQAICNRRTSTWNV